MTGHDAAATEERLVPLSAGRTRTGTS
jgi:hypothetical protein